MVQYFDFGKLGKETHWVGYLPYGVSQEGDRVFMTKRKHCVSPTVLIRQYHIRMRMQPFTSFKGSPTF
jgi:hypothetical protein